MIKFVRLDERLIHGQVAVKWIKQFNITHVIVAKDSLVKDNLMKKTLKMAAPEGTKVAVQSITGTAKMLQNPKADNANIMLIVDNPADALELIRQIPKIKEINVGNYGRNSINHEPDERKQLTKNIYVNGKEREEFKNLVETGRFIYFQTVPEDKKEDLKDILGGK